jgi:hypothetical protein
MQEESSHLLLTTSVSTRRFVTAPPEEPPACEPLLAAYVHRCAVPICLMCTSGAPRPDPAPSCIPSEASSFSKSAAGCAEMSNETP